MYGNVQSRADFARNNVNEVNSLHEAYVEGENYEKDHFYIVNCINVCGIYSIDAERVGGSNIDSG